MFYNGTRYIYSIAHPYDEERERPLTRTHPLPHVPCPPEPEETATRQFRVRQFYALQSLIYQTAVEFGAVGWSPLVAVRFYAGFLDYIMEVRLLAERRASRKVKFEGLVTLEYIGRASRSVRPLLLRHDDRLWKSLVRQLLEGFEKVTQRLSRAEWAEFSAESTLFGAINQLDLGQDGNLVPQLIAASVTMEDSHEEDRTAEPGSSENGSTQSSSPPTSPRDHLHIARPPDYSDRPPLSLAPERALRDIQIKVYELVTHNVRTWTPRHYSDFAWEIEDACAAIKFTVRSPYRTSIKIDALVTLEYMARVILTCGNTAMRAAIAREGEVKNWIWETFRKISGRLTEDQWGEWYDHHEDLWEAVDRLKLGQPRSLLEDLYANRPLPERRSTLAGYHMWLEDPRIYMRHQDELDRRATQSYRDNFRMLYPRRR